MDSAVISRTKLQDMRDEFESPENKVTELGPKKKIKPMTVRGSKRELEEKFGFNPKSPAVQFTIQLRAFSREGKGKERAETLRDHLKKRKYNAFIITEGTVYRVCEGKYPKDSRIIQERFKLLQSYFPDAFIRKLP